MNPKLREVRAQPMAHREQKGILLTDPLGVSEKALFIPHALAPLLALLDGSRDLGTIRTGFELRTGIPISTPVLENLISQLDSAQLLDNEHFAQAYRAAIEDFRIAASRQPVLASNCYPADPKELTAVLQGYFDNVEILDLSTTGAILGIISPHIDFARGWPVYAKTWANAAPAIKEEQAELIVILGTDHNGRDGAITLTHQNYETPWGILPTDREIVSEIARSIGEADAFRDELHHRGEHSIEAALIWLQYVLGDMQCNIVPILCGSFQSFIDRSESASQDASISATIEALRKVVAVRRTIIVAAADLAHVGPAFGDSLPLDITGRARLANQDHQLLDILSQGNAEAFFQEIRAESDQRRICGMPPIYIALSALSEVKGNVTGYTQCPASEDGGSLVSICGVLYHSHTS
jgi:AmmeMemoRadiSam system protein B